MSDGLIDIVKQATNAIGGLLFGTSTELITLLRTPTPIKVTKVMEVEPSGCIGMGLDTPDPVTLYTCPMSAEAWLHRIAITALEYTPSNPLTQGEIRCTGTTAGEPIFSLPHNGDLTDVYILEGRLSSPHLNPGESAVVVGDLLPPGIHMRFDLQIILTQGLSEYTPRVSSPTNIDKRIPNKQFTLID